MTPIGQWLGATTAWGTWVEKVSKKHPVGFYKASKSNISTVFEKFFQERHPQPALLADAPAQVAPPGAAHGAAGRAPAHRRGKSHAHALGETRGVSNFPGFGVKEKTLWKRVWRMWGAKEGQWVLVKG